MKKPKFIFKLNRNNTAKVYVNKKWLKYVTKVDLLSLPYDHSIQIEQCVTKNGKNVVENGEIERKIRDYHFKGVMK